MCLVACLASRPAHADEPRDRRVAMRLVRSGAVRWRMRYRTGLLKDALVAGCKADALPRGRRVLPTRRRRHAQAHTLTFGARICAKAIARPSGAWRSRSWRTSGRARRGATTRSSRAACATEGPFAHRLCDCEKEVSVAGGLSHAVGLGSVAGIGTLCPGYRRGPTQDEGYTIPPCASGFSRVRCSRP